MVSAACLRRCALLLASTPLHQAWIRTAAGAHHKTPIKVPACLESLGLMQRTYDGSLDIRISMSFARLDLNWLLGVSGAVLTEALTHKKIIAKGEEEDLIATAVGEAGPPDPEVLHQTQRTYDGSLDIRISMSFARLDLNWRFIMGPLKARQREHQNHARELVRKTDLSQWDALVIMSGDGLLFEAQLPQQVLLPTLDQLVEDVEVALAMVLVDHPRLLQQVVDDVATHRRPLEEEDGVGEGDTEYGKACERGILRRGGEIRMHWSLRSVRMERYELSDTAATQRGGEGGNSSDLSIHHQSARRGGVHRLHHHHAGVECTACTTTMQPDKVHNKGAATRGAMEELPQL
ncbi:hypothetical protein CRUP_009473 [Coryphaenoides rupestris]|nr:hypothetical protein CRUP_009473 [Coryphaenoides rupestris]